MLTAQRNALNAKATTVTNFAERCLLQNCDDWVCMAMLHYDSQRSACGDCEQKRCMNKSLCRNLDGFCAT